MKHRAVYAQHMHQTYYAIKIQNYSKHRFPILTKFALGLDSRLSLQRGADSMFVLGADTEIIVDGFIQLGGLVGQLIRWNARHFGPGGASGLTALKHVLGERGSTIIFGWFP